MTFSLWIKTNNNLISKHPIILLMLMLNLNSQMLSIPMKVSTVVSNSCYQFLILINKKSIIQNKIISVNKNLLLHLTNQVYSHPSSLAKILNKTNPNKKPHLNHGKRSSMPPLKYKKITLPPHNQASPKDPEYPNSRHHQIYHLNNPPKRKLSILPPC